MTSCCSCCFKCQHEECCFAKLFVSCWGKKKKERLEGGKCLQELTGCYLDFGDQSLCNNFIDWKKEISLCEALHQTILPIHHAHLTEVGEGALTLFPCAEEEREAESD